MVIFVVVPVLLSHMHIHLYNSHTHARIHTHISKLYPNIHHNIYTYATAIHTYTTAIHMHIHITAHTSTKAHVYTHPAGTQHNRRCPQIHRQALQVPTARPQPRQNRHRRLRRHHPGTGPQGCVWEMVKGLCLRRDVFFSDGGGMKDGE